MGWIKRNLLFVIVSAVALGLLGGAGFYIYQSWTRNSEKFDSLNEIYGKLKELQSQTPAPGNEKVDNSKIAKEQHQQIRAWIESTGKYFQPIPAIPSGAVTSEAFARALSSTVDRLQGMAKDSGIVLPDQYFFSFKAQSRELNIAAPEPLSIQLGEVKAIVQTLFSAKINALESIQRGRVSGDDANGPQGDYIDEQPVTNQLAVVTPYVVSFRCFTPELSRVLAAFATSTNAFLIKSINIQPAGAGAASAASADMPLGMPAGPPGMMPGMMPIMPTPAVAPGSVAPAVKGTLVTVLKEQQLRVSLELEIVKLHLKS
jgi:hypothetical protein